MLCLFTNLHTANDKRAGFGRFCTGGYLFLTGFRTRIWWCGGGGGAVRMCLHNTLCIRPLPMILKYHSEIIETACLLTDRYGCYMSYIHGMHVDGHLNFLLSLTLMVLLYFQ